MGRYIAGLLCIAAGVSMLPAAQAGEVVFADIVVERLVRAVLENENDPIFASDLIGPEGVTELRGPGALIEDLGGIEFLFDLEILELPNNIISDLGALSGLRNLRTLDLSGNAISDISALENVTSLVSLDLADNDISDLTPLVALVNLSVLSLQNNAIRDLSPLLNNGGLGLGDSITRAVNSDALGDRPETSWSTGTRLNVFFQHFTVCGRSPIPPAVIDIKNTTLELKYSLR